MWWGLNACAALALALALAAMINLFVRRHVVCFDCSATRAPVLSDQTLALLRGLDEDVDVFVCFRPADPLFRPIRAILHDYALACPRLNVEFVDPDRDLAKAKALAVWFGRLDPNVVVFRNSSGHVLVRRADIAVFDDAPQHMNRPGRVLLFTGENAFSAALVRLSRQEAPHVFFLAGHGERCIDDFDPAGGYSNLARLLRRQNMEPRIFFLNGSEPVPRDAAVVIIAGPNHPLTPIEIDCLRDYLDQGGRLMIMMDLGADTGLESFLAEWGVRAGPLRAVSEDTLTGFDVLARNFGEHPLMSRLVGNTIVLNLPQRVQPMAGSEGAAPAIADRPVVSVLAKTSENGFATPDAESIQPAFNEETDQHGPIELAVAVERGPESDLKVELPSARLIVIGDSSLVSNNALKTGCNAAFFMAALNWLLERDQDLPMEPRRLDGFKIVLGKTQLNILFWLFAIVFPASAAGAGMIVRRHRMRASRGAWRS